MELNSFDFRTKGGNPVKVDIQSMPPAVLEKVKKWVNYRRWSVCLESILVLGAIQLEGVEGECRHDRKE